MSRLVSGLWGFKTKTHFLLTHRITSKWLLLWLRGWHNGCYLIDSLSSTICPHTVLSVFSLCYLRSALTLTITLTLTLRNPDPDPNPNRQQEQKKTIKLWNDAYSVSSTSLSVVLHTAISLLAILLLNSRFRKLINVRHLQVHILPCFMAIRT